MHIFKCKYSFLHTTDIQIQSLGMKQELDDIDTYLQSHRRQDIKTYKQKMYKQTSKCIQMHKCANTHTDKMQLNNKLCRNKGYGY